MQRLSTDRSNGFGHSLATRRGAIGVGLAAAALAVSVGIGATAAGAHSVNRGPVANAAAGQTLTIQFTPPVSLNPALGGTSESDVVFGALDYDSLIYQLPSGKYIGDLATSWSYKPKSHNKVFNLTLRKGVHFSDGSTMTAQSVVNSFKYFKGADGPQSAYLAPLTSAKAIGSNKVQLRFSAPAPDLPFLLSQYQNVGQIIGPKGIADPNSLTTTSDGTGPYVLSSSQTVANSSYVFTKNPEYWNPAAVKYGTVVVKVITDPQTALSSAQSGQVQALTFLPAAVQNAAKADGLKVFSEPFSIASLLLMGRSQKGSPLTKLKVRQAINDAVDRAALAKGLGGPSSVPTDEEALPGAVGYDPTLAHKYPYSPSAAKKLLKEAGYPHGFTLPVLDTLALDPNGDIGAEIKSELGKIGIQVSVTETPSPAQFVPASLSKKYSAVIWPFSQNGSGFPYAVEFSLVPFTNVFNSTSSQLDGLMALAGADSGKAATAAYQQVGAFLVNDAWNVPLFSLQSVEAITKAVANVQAPTLQNTTIDPIAPNPSLSWRPAS